MDPNLFYLRVWDLDVFKRLWLGEEKTKQKRKKLLHHFDDPLPWKQSKMATKHNYLKSLKLQSHCMQINFLLTVYTNIMVSSLLPRILWLCSSFILYYLHFMLVKMIPIIFQIGIKLKVKQISPSTNCLVKVKINTYTTLIQTFMTIPLLKAKL